MKKYFVDVHFDSAVTIPVFANSADEAQEIVQRRVDAGEVSVQDAEDTGDVEVTTAGEEDGEGQPVWY